MGSDQGTRSLAHAYRNLISRDMQFEEKRQYLVSRKSSGPLQKSKHLSTTYQRQNVHPSLLEQEGSTSFKTVIVYFFSCSWLYSHKEVLERI